MKQQVEMLGCGLIHGKCCIILLVEHHGVEVLIIRAHCLSAFLNMPVFFKIENLINAQYFFC